MTVQTGTCECGKPATRNLPDPSTAFAADLIDRVAATPLVCEACQRLEDEKAAEQDRAARDQEAQDRYRRRVAASGLPAGLRHNDSGELDPEQSYAIQGWPHDPRGLLLTGPIGVGKTHAAAAAAEHCLRSGALDWTSGPLLMARLGSGLGTAIHDDAVRVLQHPRALVLDDLDKARPTEYGAEQMFVAVDTRVTNHKPLLVTTNLDLGELARKWPSPYGEAIASRLAGYCVVHALTGPDRRTA